MTRILRYMLAVGCGIMGILLFVLASASDNSDFLEDHYPWLLGINVLVALALLALIIVISVRLFRRYRRRKFGSRLMARLVVLFGTIGILPGLVIYGMSVQFVSRSIESWFDVHVESALHAGVKLGQVVLDSALAELNVRALHLARDLAELSPEQQTMLLVKLREQGMMKQAVVVTSSGQVVASANKAAPRFEADVPTQAMLLQARVTAGYSAIEGGTDPDGMGPQVAPPIRLRVVVAIPVGSAMLSRQGETYFLQMLQPLPKSMATHAESLSVAYSEYKARSLGRSGLRKMYLVTLSLTLLLAIFGAIASAFMLATNLARPLLLLAQGTKAVAEGDLSPRPIVASPDELGLLTQSFNAMTKQLADAREAREKSRTELENAKIYLESVLGNMSAGVMVLDAECRLVSCNESVERILQHEMQSQIGQNLSEIEGLAPMAAAISRAFSERRAQAAAGGEREEATYWQQQIEVPRLGQHAEDENHEITLLARGSTLPVRNGVGSIVVFDDISDVISAQRSIAWGEVARRLAHEIKNPLTPIQLAAERMQMKLEDKLDEKESAILKKGTATIVNQVESMKRMVDDFRNYARVPVPVLVELDLNALIEEIMHLYTGGETHEVISMKLASNLPKVMADETQLRQVIHNLLQNAQDAVRERPADGQAPRVEVVTEAVNYQGEDGRQREAVRLSVTDNGPGFSQRILARAFEPYVTSKARGTGLGLAMVKKIVDEHDGRIDIQNRTDGSGAKVSILLLKLAGI